MTIGENLKRFRKKAGLSQADLAKLARVSQQLVSQIERGENGSTKELPAFADVLGVPVSSIDPKFQAEAGVVTYVPVLTWVSAGALESITLDEMEEYPTRAMADLGPGDWIALIVEGTSMDRISPPGSIIAVDRRDKRLVPNACYVIATETGEATYKRFRPSPDRFEPVSTFADHPTIFPEGPLNIIGRVRRSVLPM